MKLKFKGNCPNQDWNKDLTVGKEYDLEFMEKDSYFITDDIGDLLFISGFRISEFEIIGGDE